MTAKKVADAEERVVEVVNDLDQHAPKPGAEVARGSAQTGDVVQQENDTEPLSVLLGRESYTWTSPYCKNIVVRFRRPMGGTREMVARILGPEHSDNALLTREYVALASIFEVSNERVRQPHTQLAFRALKQRIGFVGPEDGDWFDEPVAAFVFAYEMAMYPNQLKIRAELDGAGLSPEDEKRILKNAGLERPKA